MALSREQYRKMDMLLADPVGYSNTAIARMVGCGATTVRHRRRGEPNLGGCAPEYILKRLDRDFYGIKFERDNKSPLMAKQRLRGGVHVDKEWTLLLNGRRFDE